MDGKPRPWYSLAVDYMQLHGEYEVNSLSVHYIPTGWISTPAAWSSSPRNQLYFEELFEALKNSAVSAGSIRRWSAAPWGQYSRSHTPRLCATKRTAAGGVLQSGKKHCSPSPRRIPNAKTNGGLAFWMSW